MYYYIILLAASTTAETWCAMECECQYYNEEGQHENGGVGDTNRLPTLKPNLAAPTESVHCAPESMREVEPDCHKPDDVEHYIAGVGKRVNDVSETVGRIMRGGNAGELGKHHVV